MIRPRLLLATLRHLRARQLTHQFTNRAIATFPAPRLLASGRVSAFEGLHVSLPDGWLTPPIGANTREAILAGSLTFVNQRHESGSFPPWWQVPDASKLWLYNLHYFDWMWVLEPAEALAALHDWIERHGLARGAVGWDSYPTSLRLMNLSAWFVQHIDALDVADREVLWQSIALQARWLSRRLEYHLMGNHLLENGIALAFVGSVFAGPETDAWRERGWRILDRELAEQFPPDGMHFERSPMYQCRLLHALSWLESASNRAQRDQLTDLTGRTRRALGCLTHPDGRIALLNDSAFGVYHEPATLGAAPPPPGVWSLPDAGYYGARNDADDAIIIDAGDIGPDYIPGHAHGDMLSFELSIAGRRIITDSGTYDYVPSEMRAYCRSTRAHNTVEVACRDQAEFWSAFRVARRGHIRSVQWLPDGGAFRLRAAHEGYEAQGIPVRHLREFHWMASRSLTIRDQLRGGGSETGIARLHFAPDCHVHRDGNRYHVSCRDVRVAVQVWGAARTWTETSWYCPAFGVRKDRPVICWELGREHPMSVITVDWQ